MRAPPARQKIRIWGASVMKRYCSIGMLGEAQFHLTYESPSAPPLRGIGFVSLLTQIHFTSLLGGNLVNADSLAAGCGCLTPPQKTSEFSRMPKVFSKLVA